MLTKEQLLVKIGADQLDDASQDEMLQQLADTVKTTIWRKVLEQLNDDDLAVLEPLAEANNEAEMDAFIKTKIPDYDAWSAKIEMDFIEELENNRLAMQEQVDAKLREGLATD